MMRTAILAGSILFAASSGFTEAAAASGPSALDLMDVDVMFVGAHPDDDIGVLATFARYLVDEGHAGTVVTVTGGEAGGNATGPEAGTALGLIRHEEERRALGLVGVRSPHFLGQSDFYFTLSAEEAAARWGDGFICDVTRDVRLRRPEVLVTMWPGPGTHGQHQMAARAATLAYARAGDPSFCPEQVTRESLRPFAPAKLYYYDRPGSDATLSVPADGYSSATRLRYADTKALAIMMYRSQGYDTLQQVPVKEAQPERFLLVASRVPVSRPESHLLEGALLPAGTSPSGIRLEVLPAEFEAPIGADLDVRVAVTNGTTDDLTGVFLELESTPGLAIEGAARFERVAPGTQVEGRFRVRPSAAASVDKSLRVWARYTAQQQSRPIGGANSAWIRPTPALRVAFRPTYDVAGYREFARATRTDWVIDTLATRLPLAVGQATAVGLDISNAGSEARTGTLELQLPAGVRLIEPVRYHVAGHGTSSATARLVADAAALPSQRHSARLPAAVRIEGGGSDSADLYLLPALTIPRAPKPPVIDGDLADMQAFLHGEIAPQDLWWRKAPADAADLSAEFRLAWDARALYVGLHVRDQAVVCNIAPDDVRSQLRSDAIGVTVDPSGRSRDTSTTLQAAAFPCTTAGFAARAFRDADARPGLAEQTAPGLAVGSRRTAEGYDIEMAIPWSAMPSQPRAGDEIGLDLVLYDGDQTDARVGANISETGLAWAAFEWGGKQALPYLWGRARLGR